MESSVPIWERDLTCRIIDKGRLARLSSTGFEIRCPLHEWQTRESRKYINTWANFVLLAKVEGGNTSYRMEKLPVYQGLARRSSVPTDRIREAAGSTNKYGFLNLHPSRKGLTLTL